jgi:uncharacterized protein
MMDEFRPPWWLRNPHLQTFLGSRGDPEQVSAVTLVHRVATADDEAIALHEDFGGAADRDDAPTVLLIHGLVGSHDSGYLVRIGKTLYQNGWRVFRLDMRGCGAGETWAHKPPHAGLTCDIAASLAFIQQRCSPGWLATVGFSLGGNLVLKFLGELGRGEHGGLKDTLALQYAIAVGPPIDLSLASDMMERGAGRVYTAYFMRLLHEQLRRKIALWPQWRAVSDKVGDAKRLRTIRQFDDAFTAPLGGFASADEYYRLSSGKQFLDSIEVPCDLLVAQDDPIVPFASFQELRSGGGWLPKVHGQMVSSRYGGHLGFMQTEKSLQHSSANSPTKPRTITEQRWMDRWVCERLFKALRQSHQAEV